MLDAVSPEPAPTVAAPTPTRRPGRAVRGVRIGLGLALVGVAVGGVVLARAGEEAGRAGADAMTAEQAGAALALERAEVAQRSTQDRLDAAEAVTREAAEAREVQRGRLAEMGLTEFTVDQRVLDSLANTELVEYRRDQLTEDIDRKANSISDLRECLVLARRAVNEAFQTSIASAPTAPAPSDVCRALMAPAPG